MFIYRCLWMYMGVMNVYGFLSVFISVMGVNGRL